MHKHSYNGIQAMHAEALCGQAFKTVINQHTAWKQKEKEKILIVFQYIRDDFFITLWS